MFSESELFCSLPILFKESTSNYFHCRLIEIAVLRKELGKFLMITNRQLEISMVVVFHLCKDMVPIVLKEPDSPAIGPNLHTIPVHNFFEFIVLVTIANFI